MVIQNAEPTALPAYPTEPFKGGTAYLQMAGIAKVVGLDLDLIRALEMVHKGRNREAILQLRLALWMMGDNREDVLKATENS